MALRARDDVLSFFVLLAFSLSHTQEFGGIGACARAKVVRREEGGGETRGVGAGI